MVQSGDVLLEKKRNKENEKILYPRVKNTADWRSYYKNSVNL